MKESHKEKRFLFLKNVIGGRMEVIKMEKQKERKKDERERERERE